VKKRVVIIPAGILLVVFCFLTATGFNERTDVALVDYAVSEDGTEITLHTMVMSSMGYTRGLRDDGGGVKPHYLTFYSAFGGPNSSFGAKDSFVLELGADDSEIYFNRPDGGYELVLRKDQAIGQWERP